MLKTNSTIWLGTESYTRGELLYFGMLKMK